MTRLMAVFTGLALLVGLAAFMLLMIPTLTGLEEAFINAGAGEEQQSIFSNIKTVMLRIAPVILGLGAILYIYASVVSQQRYHGRGRGRL